MCKMTTSVRTGSRLRVNNHGRSIVLPWQADAGVHVLEYGKPAEDSGTLGVPGHTGTVAGSAVERGGMHLGTPVTTPGNCENQERSLPRGRTALQPPTLPPVARAPAVPRHWPVPLAVLAGPQVEVRQAGRAQKHLPSCCRSWGPVGEAARRKEPESLSQAVKKQTDTSSVILDLWSGLWSCTSPVGLFSRTVARSPVLELTLACEEASVSASVKWNDEAHRLTLSVLVW